MLIELGWHYVLSAGWHSKFMLAYSRVWSTFCCAFVSVHNM